MISLRVSFRPESPVCFPGDEPIYLTMLTSGSNFNSVLPQKCSIKLLSCAYRPTQTALRNGSRCSPANAGKRFGPRVLFLEANWLIRTREKTALVGATAPAIHNHEGAGGLETLDYGQMQQTRGMSIGYLPQEGLTLAGRTIFEECLTVFDELREMAAKLSGWAGS